MIKVSLSLRSVSSKIRKIADKFNFNQQYANDAERTFRTLASFIKSNDGLFKNPNIAFYLKHKEYTPEQIARFKEEDPDGSRTGWNYERTETDLERAVKRHSQPTDIGCVVTQIPINAGAFKSRWRVKEDAFIYDEAGVRIHFKVKNRYPEEKYQIDWEDWETGEKTKKDKVRVTKEFSALELVWERSKEIQEKIESSKENHSGWFNEHREKIDLILKNLPENSFNRRYIQDLKNNKKIDEKKLENLYDDAVAQTRPSIGGSGKNKTTIKITHVGTKEVESYRPYGGTDTKSQIIGISDDFKQKVIIKFGIGTRAGSQLAEAVGLPRVSVPSNFLSIQTPTCINAQLGAFTTEILSEDLEEIKVKIKPDQKKWEDAHKELDALKKGDSVLIHIGKHHPGVDYRGDAKILERNGDLITFKNPMKVKDQPYEDIHDHQDELIGKKVKVEGEFKLWNDAIFVSRPKFTKA